MAMVMARRGEGGEAWGARNSKVKERRRGEAIGRVWVHDEVRQKGCQPGQLERHSRGHSTTAVAPIFFCCRP